MTDPTKSSIPRCKHGVYSAHGTPGGKDNAGCSICQPIPVGDCKTVVLRDETGKFQNIRKNRKTQPIAG